MPPSPSPPPASLETLTSTFHTLVLEWHSTRQTPSTAARLRFHVRVLQDAYLSLHHLTPLDPTALPLFLRTLTYASLSLPLFPLPSPPLDAGPSPPPPQSFRHALVARIAHLHVYIHRTPPPPGRFSWLLDPAARLNPEWDVLLRCTLALTRLWGEGALQPVYWSLRADVDGFLAQCGGEEEEGGKGYGEWVGGMLGRLVKCEEGLRGVAEVVGGLLLEGK